MDQHPPLLKVQLHDGVQVVSPDAQRVKLDATRRVATAVPRAAAGERQAVHLKTQQEAASELTPGQRRRIAARSSYLALDPRLAAAAAARVAVEATVAAALLPRQADGAQLRFLPGVYAGNAGSPQERPPPLGRQRLQEEAIVHLHGVHVQVFVRHVLQGQEVGLSACHRSVPGQLWKTVVGE